MVKLAPPAGLLVERAPEPLPERATYGEALEWCAAVATELRQCNADKRALSEWTTAGE